MSAPAPLLPLPLSLSLPLPLHFPPHHFPPHRFPPRRCQCPQMAEWEHPFWFDVLCCLLGVSSY